MKNSYFSNPNGLDSGTQHSTAFDLSLAARELLKILTCQKLFPLKKSVSLMLILNTFIN